MLHLDLYICIECSDYSTTIIFSSFSLDFVEQDHASQEPHLHEDIGHKTNAPAPFSTTTVPKAAKITGTYIKIHVAVGSILSHHHAVCVININMIKDITAAYFTKNLQPANKTSPITI